MNLHRVENDDDVDYIDKYDAQGGGNKWKEKMVGRESNLNHGGPSDGFNDPYDTEEFKSIKTNF